MTISEMNLELHRAIWAGDLARAAVALERGADPNAPNARRNSPLVCAAMTGNTAIAEMLLQREADPNGMESDGSALHWAIFNGDMPLAHALLDAGANVSWADLQHASSRHIVTVVQAILDRGVDVNGTDWDGTTALMSASFVGDAATVRLLLDRGAEVNARTPTGWAALLCAAAKGHTAVVRMLLAAGADITTHDKDGDTALKLATTAGHTDVVRALTEAGAKN